MLRFYRYATREAAKGRSASVDEINRIRQRVFGLPPIDAESAEEETNPQELRRMIREVYGLPEEAKPGNE